MLVDLTALEAKALRMAVMFGAPDPIPPEIDSAVRKLGEAEVREADASGEEALP